MKNKPVREYHLSSYIAISIIFLVVISILTVSGFLYFSLEKTLTAEFEQRVMAESREIVQAMENSFQRVESKLKTLTADNTVRVTLMLGATSQLQERLNSLYTDSPDIDFLIMDKRTGQTFKSTGNTITTTAMADVFSHAEGVRSFTRNSVRQQFEIHLALPVTRQQDRIGTAAAIYRFKDDSLLNTTLGLENNSGLLTRLGSDIFDLLSGEKISTASILSPLSKEEKGVSYIDIPTGSFALVQVDTLPELYFITNVSELTQAKKQVLLSVMLPAILIIILSLIISWFLSDKLAQPIRQLSVFANSITKSGRPLPPQRGSTGILELRQLEESLITMLANLDHAREMERYQELFEGVADMVLIYDFDGSLVDVNDVTLKKLGYPKTFLLQQRLNHIIPGNIQGHLTKLANDTKGTDREVYFTATLKDSLGQSLPVECHARRILYRSKPVILNVLRDISDRVKAEKALKDSHETLLTVLDGIQAGIYVSNPNTKELLFMNKYLKEQLGGDFTGHNCHEVICKTSLPCRYCVRETFPVAEINQQELLTWESQNPVDGKWYLNYDRLIRWVDGSQVKIRLAFDISRIKDLELEKSQAQSRLRKIQKMEALGTLAGGVAHDLNNILCGVVSYPDLILKDLPDDSPHKSLLLAIKNTGLKASAIVEDLLTLARRGVVVNAVVNLNDIVLDYLQSPEYSRLKAEHTGIDLITELDENLLNIIGSPIHLTKTLMNLVSNSAESIQDRGDIAISTTSETIRDTTRADSDIRPGEYVVLTVSDSGCGIAPEDLDRIYEPFFTTKTMGKSGSGLGMAVIWGTIEDHEGYIKLDSELDRGTTFRLYFPVTRKEMIEEQSIQSQMEIAGKGESILVVDDVPEQREVASLMFSQLGYRVETAESGESAVAYLKDHAVDLIILDMIMEGGMNGLETYREVLKMYPDQKAIVTTGYSKTEHVQEALSLGAGQYVKKPYLVEEMAAAVRQELARE